MLAADRGGPSDKHFGGARVNAGRSVDRDRPVLGDLTLLQSPPPERSDAARNRQRILQAARELIDERGPQELTMNEVAAHAGVGVGTVYRRFGDQAGLVDALMDEHERELQEQMISGPPPLGPGAEPVERIKAFLHAFVDLLELYAPVMATVRDDPRTRGGGAYNAHHQHLAILIRQVRPGLDATYLAGALLTNLEARRFLAQRNDLGYGVDQIKAGLDQLVTGLG
ncbi:TetR/AcrR family transcriptional regulator [Microlunatus elymi]|uniref:TetR/AcrR family transcriptional regulator n=2 Tax=Microlunatus elymi TaxID=2596828 RepID=A0A516Q528_9ACTN|nr:TetR/AcrR family transcriptional regulator [Microlunatus elymi]